MWILWILWPDMTSKETYSLTAVWIFWISWIFWWDMTSKTMYSLHCEFFGYFEEAWATFIITKQDCQRRNNSGLVKKCTLKCTHYSHSISTKDISGILFISRLLRGFSGCFTKWFDKETRAAHLKRMELFMISNDMYIAVMYTFCTAYSRMRI